VVVACLAAIGGGAVALAVWQWLAFSSLDWFFSFNPRAVTEWRRAVGLGAVGDRPPVAPSVYTAVFRALLIEMWLAYAVLLWRVRVDSGRPLPPPPAARQVLRVAIPMVALVALVAPPLLSTDVFAYVGYGRLAVVHHLNPHLYTQADLLSRGDPTTPYLHWPIASPYGPLWTIVSMLVVRVAPAGAIVGPVVALKLLGGAALVVVALLAGRLARDLDGDPRRADGVFAATIANPILLLEGPGNAHNDLAMMAAVLGAMALLARGRFRGAAALAGVAAAVKLMPLMMVPWLAVAAARARMAAPPRERRWPAALGAGASVVALAMAPVVAAYAPFWSGLRTLAGLGSRWQSGSGLGTAPVALGAIAWNVAPLAVALGALSLWAILAPPGEAAKRAVTAWAWAALAILLFAAGVWYPWYLVWIWPAVLIRANLPHRLLAALIMAFGVFLTLVYTVVSF